MRAHARRKENMLDLQIITIRQKNPRWKLDISNYNEITVYEKDIIDEISMILEEANNRIDQENKELEDLPFN